MDLKKEVENNFIFWLEIEQKLDLIGDLTKTEKRGTEKVCIYYKVVFESLGLKVCTQWGKIKFNRIQIVKMGI